MSNMKPVIFTACLLALAGCTSSVPPCDDKEVAKTLKEILAEQDFLLLNNNGISTTKSAYKMRICKSLMKVRDKQTNEIEELVATYEINLADNGREFIVTLRYE